MTTTHAYAAILEIDLHLYRLCYGPGSTEKVLAVKFALLTVRDHYGRLWLC